MTRCLFTSLSIAVAITFSSHPIFGQAPGAAKKMELDSPLLQPWTGPHGGVPPWNLVRSEEFVTAFDAAISESNAEIKAITDNKDEPNFENTVVAMERAGRTLSRLEAIFFVYTSNLNVGPIPDIEKVIVPKLSEYEDSVYQNK
ncbi:MAG: M3 family peptidase, partial [Rubripirellula sp.]|nr:M3 family peptidase [Rubripirellula sp.]